MSRRNDILQMTPAELAIRDAVIAVEKVGADPRLTRAVILLDEAQNKVADFVDNCDQDDDGHVAYLRFVGQGARRHLSICDSDAIGAFKVYRRCEERDHLPLDVGDVVERSSCQFCGRRIVKRNGVWEEAGIRMTLTDDLYPKD